MKIFFIFLISLFFAFPEVEASNKELDKLSKFSGRISRINEKASLVRVRVRFKNMKFLNKRDKIEFWSEVNPSNRCLSYLVSKSNEYILIRVPNFETCITKVGFTVGAYLFLSSTDMKNTLDVAQEMIKILLKKRLALGAMKNRHQNDINAYIDKVDAINKRYQVIKEKMELEWEKEISALEKDKSDDIKNLREVQSKLDNLDHKLEKYRIYDHNLELDRWSLDSKLYRIR